MLVFDFSIFQTAEFKVILNPNFYNILRYSIPTACESHLKNNYLAPTNEESKRKISNSIRLQGTVSYKKIIFISQMHPKFANAKQ
jgi:hypothetical protein